MVVKSYRDLRVYQMAFVSAMQIFHLTHEWPAHEKYSLTDQIRRSSRSVCSNLGEAWRRRRYPAHFASKLGDCDSEAAETEVWLDFALECGYISKTTHQELRAKYDHIGAMLTKMIDDADKWCNKT